MSATLEESFVLGQDVDVFLPKVAELPVPPVDKNVIPPITDPMGKHWNQPSSRDFLIDDSHVVISRRAFEELSDYSNSQPSGVYPGKMWRTLSHTPYKLPMGPVQYLWCLRWFGVSSDPKYCTNNCRVILFE